MAKSAELNADRTFGAVGGGFIFPSAPIAFVLPKDWRFSNGINVNEDSTDAMDPLVANATNMPCALSEKSTSSLRDSHVKTSLIRFTWMSFANASGELFQRRSSSARKMLRLLLSSMRISDSSEANSTSKNTTLLFNACFTIPTAINMCTLSSGYPPTIPPISSPPLLLRIEFSLPLYNPNSFYCYSSWLINRECCCCAMKGLSWNTAIFVFLKWSILAFDAAYPSANIGISATMLECFTLRILSFKSLDIAASKNGDTSCVNPARREFYVDYLIFDSKNMVKIFENIFISPEC